MATDPKQFRTQLNAEINQDLSKFASRFIQELRASTPIRTGFARKSWVNKYTSGLYGSTTIIPLASNSAPYIGVLDSNRTSTQAPEGIVVPALNKARKR